MKTFAILILLILNTACVKSKTEVHEDCKINGKDVPCNLVRGVTESKAESTGVIDLSLEVPVNVDENQIIFLVSKKVEKTVGEHTSYLEVRKNEVLKFEYIDEDHMLITAEDGEKAVWERLDNSDTWMTKHRNGNDELVLEMEIENNMMKLRAHFTFRS